VFITYRQILKLTKAFKGMMIIDEGEPISIANVFWNSAHYFDSRIFFIVSEMYFVFSSLNLVKEIAISGVVSC